MIEMSPENARETLTRLIARLFGAPSAGNLILSPGILIALGPLFSSLGIKKLVVSDEEYYEPLHFRGLDVTVEPSDRLHLRTDADAILLSLVTWRGSLLPVERIVHDLRKGRSKAARPLIVVDYSHGGAAGFPPLDGLGADLVCGDVLKWVIPPQRLSRLAFLWTPRKGLFSQASDLFAGFYLATPARSKLCSARWVDPQDLLGATRILDQCTGRDELQAQHLRNMNLAREVASQLGIRADLKTSILWVPEGASANHGMLRELERAGVLWKPPLGGSRILCYAGDALERT